MSIGLLMDWSFRRIRDSLAVWFRIIRLTLMDWTVVVYLYIPSFALLIYEGMHYYRGLWFIGMSPDQPWAGPFTFRSTAMVLTFLFMLLIHMSSFGHIPFPLRSGDKAFALTAPVDTRMWFWTLWIEGWLWLSFWFLLTVLLTLPILWFLHVSILWWCLTLLLTAAYMNTARVAGTLWRQEDDFRFWRFIILQLLRVCSFVPLADIGSSLASHSMFTTLWILPVPLAVSLLILRWMKRHLSWDPLFRGTASAALAFVGASDPTPKQTVYSMRAPSQWFVHGIEFVVRRPLHPVLWMLIIRALRTRGIWRTYITLSAGAVLALRLTAGPIKVIGAGFFVFLLYQYWKMNIRPLIHKPMMEQTIVEWGILNLTEIKILTWSMILTGGLWLLLWQLGL